MKIRLGSRVVCLSMLLFASGVFASDGVIEINQTCAVQTGCLPGDAPGFPVSLDQGTSFILTSDLTVSGDVSALLVGVSRATIDLNGFTITGDYSCATAPPDCIARASNPAINGPNRSVVVRRGIVREWQADAILVGSNSLVEDMLVERSGNAGIVAGSGSIVRNDRVDNLRGTGIHIRFDPNSDRDGLVEGNVVSSVRGDGIRLSGGLVTKNYTSNVFGDNGAFGATTAYGLNRFSVAPVGGASLGNNSCGTVLC